MDEQQEHAPQTLLPTLMSRLGLNTTHTSIKPTTLNGRIAALQQQASLETLLQALDDEDESVRAIAVRELEQWGTQVPLNNIIVCLHDPSWLVREAAVLTLGTSGIFDVMSDENEFVRDASLLVQQDSFKTHSLSSTIRNTRTRLFSALTTVDNLLLHIGSEGRIMDSQGATSNGELEARSTQARKGRRRTVLGVTGGMLALLVVVGVVFSWLAVTQKLPFTTTSQKKSLDAPVLTTINQMQDPHIQWSSDSQYLIESDPYNLEDATLVNIQTKAEAQRDVFGLVSDQLITNGIGAFPQTTWTPDGQYLLNSSADNGTGQITVEIWNVVAGHKVLNISYQDKTIVSAKNNNNDLSNAPNPPPVSVSPDNTRLALGKSDGTIEIWNIATGSKIATYKGDTSAIQRIQWYVHGQKLLSQSKSGVVQIWDVATSKRILLFHPPFIKETSYTYSDSGQPAAAQQITVPAGVDISPDGTRILAVSGKNAFQMWDTTTGQLLTTFTEQTPYGIDTAYWLQDNVHVVFTSSEPSASISSKPSEIRIVDSSTGHTVLSTQTAPNGGYYFSPSEKYLVTENTDKKSMAVWDVATGRQVSTYHNATTINLGNGGTIWSPDERYITTMSKNPFQKSENNVVQVWDTRTGKIAATYHSHSNQVNDVQWSPDGKYLATVSDADLGNAVEVWQAPH